MLCKGTTDGVPRVYMPTKLNSRWVSTLPRYVPPKKENQDKAAVKAKSKSVPS